MTIYASFQHVPVVSLRNLQAGISDHQVRELAILMKGKRWSLPPVVVLQDIGEGCAILDGHHRVAAARTLALNTIPAWVVPLAEYDQLLKERFGGAPRGFLIEALDYVDCGGISATALGNELPPGMSARPQ